NLSPHVYGLDALGKVVNLTTFIVPAPTRAAPFLTSTPGREQRCPGTGWLRSEPTARLAWSPPRKSPTAPAPSTAGDTTSRPTANAMRLAPPLVRMVLVRYAAPAPGGSGGLFSSRRYLFARVRGPGRSV